MCQYFFSCILTSLEHDIPACMQDPDQSVQRRRTLRKNGASNDYTRDFVDSPNPCCPDLPLDVVGIHPQFPWGPVAIVPDSCQLRRTPMNGDSDGLACVAAETAPTPQQGVRHYCSFSTMLTNANHNPTPYEILVQVHRNDITGGKWLGVSNN